MQPLLTLLSLLASVPGASDESWYSHVVLKAPTKLGGCAVGDLDPGHEGDEAVAVGADGSIYLARGTRGHWSAETIHRASGELIQCAIGDADPTRPGNELVAVGMKEGTEDDGGAGIAILVWREDDGWKSRTLVEPPSLLHGCTIADLDPSSAGPEVFVTGFDRVVWQISLAGDEPDVGQVCTLRGDGKCVVPFAGGLAIATTDGRLFHTTRGRLGWLGRVIDMADAGHARLAALDDTLVAARDDGKLLLVKADEPEGKGQPIYSEDAKLRGAAIGDFVPDRPGYEVATAGYEGRLTVLTRVQGAWTPRTVYADESALHHLAAGELNADSPGLELVTCGYSGRLVVAGLEYRAGVGATESAPESSGDESSGD